MLVLSKIGRQDVAYRLLFNDTFPSWGFSTKQGATSIWERWDGWTPEKGFQDPGMNSFAHYCFGAVYQWMVENIGGIKSDGPAYKQILIEPHPGGRLTHAETSYQSIRGQIATSWIKEGETLSLIATIFANTTATVILPASGPEAITENGRSLNQSEGVKVENRAAGRTPAAISLRMRLEETADPRKFTALSSDEKAKQLARDAVNLKEHWRVENNEIVNDGQGVYLTTDKDYGDIELCVDFKIGPKGDSGVYLRGTPQVQIWDFSEPSYANLGADKGSGGLWNNSPWNPGKD